MNSLKIEETLKDMESFFNKLGIKEGEEIPSVETLTEMLEKNPNMVQESLKYIDKFQQNFKEISEVLYNTKR